MDIYVGNLPFSVTEEEIRQAFGEFGEVSNVHLVMDRETGRPRGFGFVSMTDASEAKAAIDALDGSELGGRPMKINEARPREDRPRSGGGGGGGGGFRGGDRGGDRGGRGGDRGGHRGDRGDRGGRGDYRR